MKDSRSLEFNCKICGGHKLIVTRVWTVLAGPDSKSWQEWGLLESDHLWHFDFKEQIEQDEDKVVEAERGDYGEFAEDDSASEPDEYEMHERDADLEGDEFYVNCAGCDREIEFGWSLPDRGGRIFPEECSDFIPTECWPEPRYLDSWRQKNWLKVGTEQP